MDYFTHNDLLWKWIVGPTDLFQNWVGHMPLDMDFDWADGPLDSPNL